MGCCLNRESKEEHNQSFFANFDYNPEQSEDNVINFKSENQIPIDNSKGRESPKEASQLIESNSETMQYGIQIDNDEEEKVLKVEYPKLLLEFNEILFKENGKHVVITPNTINGVYKKSGKAFKFGRANGDGPALNNDVTFSDEKLGKNQFEINFVREEQEYYVVDNRHGTGLFLKVYHKLKIDKEFVVSFCASHVLIKNYEEDNGAKGVKVAFIQGPEKNRIEKFDSSRFKEIKLGRSKNNEIVYADESVSRIQCTFTFENNCWCLQDGYREKHSTNGLWVLASHKMKITNGLSLKTGNITFQARIVRTPAEE